VKKGYYSIIQYCPDRFRAESVNVGLVLMRTYPNSVLIKTMKRCDRAYRLFNLNESQRKNMKLSITSLGNRIRVSSATLKRYEDLTRFSRSLANDDMRMTCPRIVNIDSMQDDFDRLFSKLVHFRRIY